MTNVIEAIKKIKDHAEKISTQDIRVVKKHVVGKAIRQGDLYIHMVKDDFPVGDKIETRQLAEGISLGARHILAGKCKVFVCKELPAYMSTNFRTLVNFAFDVYGEGAVLTHPEHAHIEFPCAGRYVVTYQMDARTLVKVRD